MTLGRTSRNITEAFTAQGFVYLWTGSAVFSFAQWMERTAVSWLVLEETGSVFLTALSWAARTAPGMVVGPVAGALADRVSRPKLLVFAGLLKALVLAAIAAVAVADEPPVWLVLVLVLVSGAAMTVWIAAAQPLARDLVGPEKAMQAISINSFGQRLVGAPGAFVAGFMIESAGIAWTVAVAAVLMAGSSWLYALIRRPPRAVRAVTSLREDVVEGMKLLGREPTVAVLLAVMVVTENLGFSVNAVLPSVADEVMNVGAAGYGSLLTAIGVGSVVGTLGLAALGDYRYKGHLLAGVVAGFGALLIALGFTEVFAVGLLIVAGLGAAMAAVDALEWILLQAAVAEEFRGRAIGAWNMAMGFGWIGPVVLGGTASFLGVQAALAMFGVVLLVVGLGVGRWPRLRAL